MKFLWRYNENTKDKGGKGLMQNYTFLLLVIIVAIIIIFKLISRIRFLRKRKAINQKLEAKLKEENFNPTKTITLTDCRTFNSLGDDDKQKIFVDANNKKLFLTDYSKEKFYTIAFGDVVDSEIYETSSISGRRKRDINECCNSMKLIIKINNMDMPQISYDIVFGRKIDKESSIYRNLRSSLQEVESFFDVIKSEKTAKAKSFVYCKYCGAKNHEESLKCESCGGDLK